MWQFLLPLILVWIIVPCFRQSFVACGFSRSSMDDVVREQSIELSESTELKVCPCESAYGVVWPTSHKNGNVSSSPVCLDEHKLIMVRQCIRGEWWPKQPPRCQHVQKQRSNEDGFTQLDDFQLFVYGDNMAVYRSDPRPFSTECIKFGSTENIVYQNRLFHVHSDFYWLPIRRFRRFYPHVWKIPGPDWGRVTEEYNRLGNDECLIMNFTSEFVRATPCDQKYSQLCLSMYKSPLLELACGGKDGGVTTRFYSKDPKCYSMATECEKYFRFSEPYDATIYLQLLKENSRMYDCRIDIDPFLDGMPFEWQYWTEHLDEVSYVNWAQSMPTNISYLNSTALFAYADREGFWNLGSNPKCSVCERALVRNKLPTLMLHFDEAKPELQLIVTDRLYLWTDHPDRLAITCYTTATDALLDNAKVEGSIASNTYYDDDLHPLTTVDIFRVRLTGDGPGQFWCNAIRFPDFDIVTSNTIVAYRQKRGTVFAFIATHSCKPSCKNQFDKVYLKDISARFKKYLKTWEMSMNIADVRVMDIVEADARTETLLFHVSFEVHLSADQLKELDCVGGSNDRDWIRDVNEVDYVLQQLSSSRPNSDLETFREITYNHTMVCVDRISKENTAVKLLAARIGERAISSKLCLDENRLMQHRLCDGDFPYGATWGEHSECGDKSVPKFTQNLFNLVNSANMSMEDVRHVADMMVEESEAEEYLNPTDVYLLGRVMRSVSDNVTDRIGNLSNLGNIAKIFSELLSVDDNVAQISHYFMNGTNLILDSYEQLLQRCADELNTYLNGSENEWGVLKVHTNHMLSLIIDPLVAGVRGIALYKSARPELMEGNMELLFPGLNVTDLMQDNNLDSAVYIPDNLWDHLLSWSLKSNHSIRIVVTVMDSSVLFRTDHFEKDRHPVSRIVTASIPNYREQLPVLFPIIFRAPTNLNSTAGQCVFWQFQSPNRSRISEWSDEGCILLTSNDDMHMCGCHHFTNFAFLITGANNNNNHSIEHLTRTNLNLDIITLFGCTLSLCGIVVIWITAILFRNWREKEGSRILLQLSCGIALQVTTILLINVDGILAKSQSSCIAIGIILHYSVLVVFAWMLITAYLQYMRYIVVFGNLLPKRFYLKAMLVGWLLPCLPIIVICAVDVNLYVPSGIDDFATNICYPQGNALYYGVMMPVATIILINLTIFIMIIYNITINLNMNKNKNKTGCKQIHMAQLRLTFLLFFLLGLTWTFGLLVHLQTVTLIATYLFCFFGTMQGFVLFFYFVILDPTTRNLWLKYFACCDKQEQTSSTQNTNQYPVVSYRVN